MEPLTHAAKRGESSESLPGWTRSWRSVVPHGSPVFSICLFLVAVSGCKSPSSPAGILPDPDPNASDPVMPPPAKMSADAQADTFTLTGTIVWKALEGGFFAIHADDGEKYDPINLPDSIKKDGLRVSATARLKKGAVSFHMYGSIVEIVDIGPIQESSGEALRGEERRLNEPSPRSRR